MAVVFVPRLDREVQFSVLESSILFSFQSLGYESPTNEQSDIIMSFIKGHDLFVVLPTGSGKSMCFVTLPLVFKRLIEPSDQIKFPIVVAITPLTSLMKDQVKKYGGKGLRCAFIGDTCSDFDKESIVSGRFNLLYASPEALLTNSEWRSMLHNECYQNNLVALVVDEAHCIHSW